MAVRDLLWACPLCAAAGGLRADRRGERCDACGAEFRRDLGATIIASTHAGGATRMSAGQWLERLPPRDPASLPSELGPEPVALRVAVRREPVRRGRELIGWLDRFGPSRRGHLRLTPDRLRFDAPDGTVEWELDRIAAVQPTSSKLQIAARRMPVAAIRFLGGSIRLWEEAIREAVRRSWRARDRSEITEFHPRITVRRPVVRRGNDETERAEARAGHGAIGVPTRPPSRGVREHSPSYVTEDQHRRRRRRAGGDRSPARYGGARGPSEPRWRSTRPEPFYRVAQWLPRTFWRSFSRLDVAGLDNVPPTGPFLLISNHQSNLDPILIQAVCPRRVHTMAKSTQFTVPVIAGLMKRLHSFPVRRYQTDPQAVRIVLRRLAQGEGVAIYVEGERTWDGKLQPPRLGTIRLALKAGVPIVPTTITGSYDAWPRWDSRIQLRPIAITFGPAIHLPHLHRKADREAALPAAATTIMDALRRQLDDDPLDRRQLGDP